MKNITHTCQCDLKRSLDVSVEHSMINEPDHSGMNKEYGLHMHGIFVCLILFCSGCVCLQL